MICAQQAQLDEYIRPKDEGAGSNPALGIKELKMIAIDSYVVRKYGNTEEVFQVTAHHVCACHISDASGTYIGLIDSDMLTEVSFVDVIIHESDGKSRWIIKKDA